MPIHQIVVSPKNFFLFTPLLPSVAVGTLNARSILQREFPSYSPPADFKNNINTATRYLTRHKQRQVVVIEAEAKEVDVRLFSYVTRLTLKCFIYNSRLTKL